MIQYALRRLLISIPLILVATFLIFTVMSFTGDPLADLRQLPNITQERIDMIRASRGLDQPFWVQYGNWLAAIPNDGFGTYLTSQRQILPDIQRVMGNTLQLVLTAEIFAFTLAIFLGVVSARKQYSIFDYFTTTISFFGLAMPSFWFALILQLLVIVGINTFGIQFFPIASLSSSSPGTGLAFWIDRAWHLVLPILTLSLASIATYSRYMRASMLEVIHADYVRTARSKGLPERTITVRHAMRNAMIPTVTITALSIGTLFAGSIIVERVFGLDGMGNYFIEHLGSRDPYPIMAWLLIVGTLIVVFNLVADIVYGLLDPRIRQ